MNEIAEAIRMLAVYGLIAVCIPYLYRVLRIIVVAKIILDACRRISELAKKDLSPAGAGHPPSPEGSGGTGTHRHPTGPGPRTPPAHSAPNVPMGAEGHPTSSEEPS